MLSISFNNLNEYYSKSTIQYKLFLKVKLCIYLLFCELLFNISIDYFAHCSRIDLFLSYFINCFRNIIYVKMLLYQNIKIVLTLLTINCFYFTVNFIKNDILMHSFIYFIYLGTYKHIIRINQCYKSISFSEKHFQFLNQELWIIIQFLNCLTNKHNF